MPWTTIPARRHTAQPTLTLQRSGRLAWNQPLQEALGDPDEVELLYDPELRRLAVRPDPRDAGYRVYRTSQGSYCIACETALKRLGLVGESAYRDEAEAYGGGLWALILPPVDGATGGR